MSQLRDTDLFYVDRGGVHYQVTWKRIRERNLLPTDKLLMQRADDMVAVEIGSFWNGDIELNTETAPDGSLIFDFFEVERDAKQQHIDQYDQHYKGKLWAATIDLPPFFAIEFVGGVSVGDVLQNVQLNYEVTSYKGDNPKIQRPDGTVFDLGTGLQTLDIDQDGIWRFSGDFTQFYFEKAECEVNASLTPGKTWNKLHANNAQFGQKLFKDIDHLTGVPLALELRSLNQTFARSGIDNSLDFSRLIVKEAVDASKCFDHSNVSTQDFSSWELSNVTNAFAMFRRAEYFAGVGCGNWDVSGVEDGSAMLLGATRFNGRVQGWQPGSLSNAHSMFKEASIFNQSLNTWTLPNLVDVTSMFEDAVEFNSTVWPVLAPTVTRLYSVFKGASAFNQPLNWDTQNVETIYELFRNATVFNRDITSWKTGNMEVMARAFQDAEGFDQAIGGWDTSAVTNMNFMFNGAQVFNQELGEWEVDNVLKMDGMFKEASTFERDISTWCVNLIPNEPPEFNESSPLGFIQNEPYNPEWGTCPAGTKGQIYLEEGELNIKVTATDEVKLTKPNGASVSYYSGTATKSFTAVGWYEIDMEYVTKLSFENSLTAKFYFAEEFPIEGLEDMSMMFLNCKEFRGVGIEGWNVEHVTNAAQMFDYTYYFQATLENWYMPNVTNAWYMFNSASGNGLNPKSMGFGNCTNMAGMFRRTMAFNGDCSAWDMSSAEDISDMFQFCKKFEPDTLNGWNTGNVKNMANMFSNCVNMNPTIVEWNTANVTNMDGMFQYASKFNQDLSPWCVPLIPSKPPSFDIFGHSSFKNHPEVQPQWGTCPAKATAYPEIESAEGSNINVDILKVAVKTQDGAVETGDPVARQYWEGQKKGESTWEELGAEGDDSLTVGPLFAEGKIRMRQEFDANNSVTVLYSNVLSVTPDPLDAKYVGIRFFQPNAGATVHINGSIDIAGTITHEDGTQTNIGPGDFAYDDTKEGVYVVTSDQLTKLNFEDSLWKIEIDERSYMDDIVDSSKMFANTKAEQDLSWWDTSGVTNMAEMFFNCHAKNVNSADGLDVSNVTNMSSMFTGADEMKLDLSSWNVTNVTDMSGMFAGAALNGRFTENSVNDWDVSNVLTMSAMFAVSSYNGDLNDWNVENCTNMYGMFASAEFFTSPLEAWEVGNVMDMDSMFQSAAAFTSDISPWCVKQFSSKPTNFDTDAGFEGQTLIQPQWGICPSEIDGNLYYIGGLLTINGTTTSPGVVKGPDGYSQQINGNFTFTLNSPSQVAGTYSLPMAVITKLNFGMSPGAEFDFSPTFDTSRIVDMSNMFLYCNRFNGDVANWDTSNVTNLHQAFAATSFFDGDASAWDTTNVTDLSACFASAADDPISDYGFCSSWNVSNVLNMQELAAGNKKFNADISGWDTSSVGTFYQAFQNAHEFNKDLRGWTVSNANNMAEMFIDAKIYNSPMGQWDVANVNNMDGMFWNAVAFKKDISPWCVPLITSKPSYFDENTHPDFIDNAPVQPQWGTCPPKIGRYTEIIDSENLSFGPIDPPAAGNPTGVNLFIKQQGSTAPGASTINRQWFKFETDQGRATAAPIAGQTGTSYVLQDGDASHSFLLIEEYLDSNGDIITFMESNTIQVTDTVTLPFDPERVIGVQLNSGTLNMAGTKTNGGKVYYNDPNNGWTESKVQPNNVRWTHSVTEPGQYVIESSNLVEFNFEKSMDALFTLDERSYVTDIIDPSYLFANCRLFNQDLHWMDTSKWQDMTAIFDEARVFNGRVDGWDTSSATTMREMFYNAREFKREIGHWNTSNVQNMAGMFQLASGLIPQSFSSWDVGNVVNMQKTFERNDNRPQDEFRVDVSGWRPAKCQNFVAMFYNVYTMNQNLSQWTVGNGRNFGAMFYNCAAYNHPMGDWDVSKANNMREMMVKTDAYLQDLSTWCVSGFGSNPSKTTSPCGNPNGEPTLWSNGSKLRNNCSFHPDWFKCPAKVIQNPIIY